MLSSFSIEQMQHIIRSLPIAICLLDREMRYIAANQKYASMLDTSLEALDGEPMANFCPADLVTGARRDFQLIDENEPVPDHEITFRGSTYLVSVNPIQLDHAASATAILLALTDISGLKKREAALADTNERLAEVCRQTKTLAETDSLTGLLNRHGVETIFTREIRRARREQTPIALIMVDVDWFKSYNDGNGHIAGDIALKEIGGAIQSAIRRPGDRGARYGGEEFIIILPNTDVAGALQVGTNVRQAVNALAIAHDRSAFKHLTVSVGVSAVKAVAREEAVETVYERLLHWADKALYAAKDSGRNAIKIYDDCMTPDMWHSMRAD